MSQIWISTAIIVMVLVVLGFYIQSRRIDDLRSEMNARFAAIDKRFDENTILK
jgi:hypothetical protein